MTEQISSAVAEATSGRSFRRWYTLIRVALIAVPILGAVPTALNLYHAWQHGIPYSQVSHKLQQYQLWVRNGDCKIDYREINAARGAKVNVGACQTTGDISIQVALENGRSIFEWIDFRRLQEMNVAGAGLFASAFAAEAGSGPQAFRMAQASTSRVVCQGWEGQSTIVRVIDEGGKCFKETIAPYQGRGGKRVEVPCNTTCPQRKSQ